MYVLFYIVKGFITYICVILSIIHCKQDNTSSLPSIHNQIVCIYSNIDTNASYNTISNKSFMVQNLCSFNVEEEVLQNFPTHLNEIMKL